MSDLPPEINTQVQFAMKKGKNVSDRMVPDLLKAISELINGSTVDYDGEPRKLKVLGCATQTSEGQWRLMFDVKNPTKGFAHVEFTIEKTGWEMCLDEELSPTATQGGE